MAKRKRKIPAVDQLSYMASHGDCSGEVKIKTTDKDRIMVNIRDLCSFPDSEETFQLIRALTRTGAAQWGGDWLERVQRFTESVRVIHE